MDLSWNVAELGLFDVCNKAFAQRERGLSFLVLPKKMLLSTDYITVRVGPKPWGPGSWA